MQPGDHTPNYTSLTDVTASDVRRLTPEPQRIAIGDFLARFGHDRTTRAIEQVRNSYSEPGHGFYHRLVRAAGKAMNKNCALSECDA